MNLKRKFYSKWNELKRNCIAQSMLALIVALWSTNVYSSSSSKDFSPSKLTMKVENESLNLVFKKIEKQLDVHFFL